MTTTISKTERDTLEILSPLNSTHKITYNYTLRQHPQSSHIGEQNTWEGIGVVSLFDLTDQWKVTMSPMIQKFQLDLNIHLTKKTLRKIPIRSAVVAVTDRQADTQTHKA